MRSYGSNAIVNEMQLTLIIKVKTIYFSFKTILYYRSMVDNTIIFNTKIEKYMAGEFNKSSVS